MTRLRAWRIISVLSLLWMPLGLSCKSLRPGQPGTPCPVSWASSESIDFESGTLRAQMQLRFRGEEIHIELIAEEQSDELVVVGLARFGVRLFALRQRGQEIIIEDARTKELEHAAIWVMDALHRAYWIEAPRQHADAETAERSFRWAGEKVFDTEVDGRRRREFAIADAGSGKSKRGRGATTPRVTIDYPSDPPESRAGRRATSIRNPWCGYEAVIAPLRSPSSRPRMTHSPPSSVARVISGEIAIRRTGGFSLGQQDAKGLSHHGVVGDQLHWVVD